MNTFIKLLKKLNFLLRKYHGDDDSFINSVDTFHDIIKSERARADRGNKKFSLLVIEVGKIGKNDKLTKKIIEFLSSRIRMSDVVGWYDKNNIAVLLPDTKPEGAWKLANELLQMNSFMEVSSPFIVYSYPSPKWPEELAL